MKHRILIPVALMLLLAGCKQTVGHVTPTVIGSATPTSQPTSLDTAAVTAEPTATAESSASAVSTATPLSEYIIPESNTRELVYADIADMDADTLALARNEIFARHGYPFKTQKYVDYFASMSWYTLDNNFKESMISDLERQNINFLSIYENLLLKGYVKVSSTLSLDLDGDGVKDAISAAFSTALDEFTLTVNGMKLKGTGDTLLKELWIADANAEDDFLEIMIPEAGPSDDPYIYSYCWKGGSIVDMGGIPGRVDQMKMDRKGMVTTTARGRVIQTWFHEMDYSLNTSHKWVPKPRASYEMNTPVTMVKSYTFQKSALDATAAFTLNAGEKATLTTTDDKSWVQVKNSAGKLGYIALDSNDPFMLPGNVFPADVFDGLNMAD